EENEGSQNTPYDIFESGGGNCDWNTGACDELKTFIKAGVTDEACIDPLKEGVEDERQEQALARQAPSSGHDQTLQKQMSELETARDEALSRVPKYCLDAAHTHAASDGQDQQTQNGTTPVFQGPVQQSEPAKAISDLIKGFADQSRAKGFPAQV